MEGEKLVAKMQSLIHIMMNIYIFKFDGEVTLLISERISNRIKIRGIQFFLKKNQTIDRTKEKSFNADHKFQPPLSPTTMSDLSLEQTNSAFKVQCVITSQMQSFYILDTLHHLCITIRKSCDRFRRAVRC